MIAGVLVGCGPTAGVEEAAFQGGTLEHAPPGTPAAGRTPSGRVLNAPFYDDGETFWVRLTFPVALECQAYRVARRELRPVLDEAWSISTVGYGPPECTTGEAVSEVAFPLGDFRDLLAGVRDGDRSLNFYVDYRITFTPGAPDYVDDDGNPIDVVGPVDFRIYLSELRPGPRPRITNVAPTVIDVTPGWNADLEEVNADRYLTGDGYVPKAILPPHEPPTFAFTAAMASVYVDGRPRGASGSDRGAGVRYFEPSDLPLPSGFRTASSSDVGLVPGVTYDLLVRGVGGLSDPDRPASLSTTGAPLEPPVSALVPFDSPLRVADTRLSFRVAPIRIEVPRLERPIGFTTPATTTVRGALILSDVDPEEIEPDLHVRAVVTQRVPGPPPMTRTLADVDLGLLSDVIAGGTGIFLSQAGESYSALGFTGTIPVPPGSPLIGLENDAIFDTPFPPRLALRVVWADGTVLFEDRWLAAFDLNIPVVPGTPCGSGGPSPGASCYWVEDTDDRDCDVDELCVAGGSSDIVQIQVTICGMTTTVPAAFDEDRGAVCTGRVDNPGAAPPGATGNSATIAGVDDAGNVSAPVGAGACFRSPPRALPAQPLDDGGAVARDARGRPMTLLVERGSRPAHTQLVVSTWDGLATWNRQILDVTTTGSWVYRGRIDQQLLPDGTVLFCATRREAPTRAGSDLGDARDDLDRTLDGALDLVRVAPDGRATVQTLAEAYPWGCSIAYAEVAGEPRLAVAFAGREGATGTPFFAGPAYVECEASADGIDCSDETASREVLRSLPALGLDPDAAYDPTGRLHLVGRGLLSGPAAARRFEEYGAFRIRVAATGASAALDHVLPEPAPTAGLGCAASYSDGYRSPRLVPYRDRFLLGYEHHIVRTTATSIRFEARTLAFAALALSAPTELGLASAGAPRRFGRAWPGGFVGGPQLRSCSGPLIEAMPSAFELWPTTSGARAFYVTRDDNAGVPGPGAFRPTSGLHDALVSGPIGGLTVTDLLIEAEVSRSPSEDSTAALLAPGFVSAFLDEDDEASVIIQRSLPVGFDFLYFEERARQWLEPRARVSGTCDARTGITLSEPVLNFELTTPFARSFPRIPWSTPRITSMHERAYPNYASNLSCALDTVMETLTPPLRTPGVGDLSFYRDVRHFFGSSVMSLASMIETQNRPAMVVGSRVFDDPTTTAVPSVFRTLRVALNGASRGVTRVGPSDSLADVVAELNILLGGSPERPILALIDQWDSTSRTRTNVRVAVLSWPTGTARPTVQVQGGALRAFFGLDNDTAVGVGRMLDASEGDRHGRLRNCSDACTGGADGTCTMPRDCIDLNPGSAPPGLEDNMLYHALRGLHVRDGMPLTRRGQTGVCVPSEMRTTSTVPADVRAASAACTPAGTVAHRGGVPIDYPAFLRDPRPGVTCSASEAPVLVDDEFGDPHFECAGCGGESPTGIPEGRPRSCRTDDDCNPTRTCSDHACSALSGPISLCNHLAAPYMGVPAGEGFCATPITCPTAGPTCVPRTVGAFTEAPALRRVLVSTVPGFGVPAPLNVGAGDFGISALGARCTMTGCTMCVGDTVNGFCAADAECAPGHVCLRTTAADLALETPACLLRPLLHDGRVHDLPAYLRTSTDGSVSSLNFDPNPAPGRVGIVTDAVNTLNTTVTDILRAAVMPARIVSDPLDAEPILDPAGDGGERVELVALERIDFTLQGAVVEVEPLPPNASVPGYLPGTDALHITVFIDGPVLLGGRVQIVITDLVEPEGSFGATIDPVRAVSFWVLPMVTVRDGAEHVTLRPVETTVLESSIARGDGADRAINNDNITLRLGGDLGAFIDVMRVFLDRIWSTLLYGVIGNPPPDWFGDAISALPVSDVGRLFESVATTPILGPMFLGLSPVMERTRVYEDGGVGPRAIEDAYARSSFGLDLRFRGAHLGDDLALLFRAQDDTPAAGASACCVAGRMGMTTIPAAERDPGCLERLPLDATPAEIDAACPVLCP